MGRIFYLISRYFSTIVQKIEFPIITTIIKTERTVAQAIAVATEIDRMAIFHGVDGSPRKEKKITII